MGVDHDDIGRWPTIPCKSLKERRHGARLSRTGRADHCGVTHYESPCIKTHRDLFGCGKAPDSHLVFVCGWKNDAEIVRRRKVHGVIQARVGAHAPLESTRATVDLSEQLHLEPAFPCLNHLGRPLRAGQLGNTKEADLTNQVNETLGQTH